ncbi:HEAT repeat domain-containing protein [Streptomyces sp. NPDC001970]
MINELDSIDWSSMTHAYGPAGDVPAWLRALGSPDAEVREKALGDFYGAVHHQGDVYACTTASLPFLFAVADDPATPDRASIVELLVSIGRHAVERCEIVYVDGPDYAGSAVVVRERADAFVSYASDADPLVRRAAIEGLGLFVDDADRAAALLRDRLPAEDRVAERLLVVETMATLALRLPAARDAATAWLDALAADAVTDPAVRLAAVVHGARCTPERIGVDTVPAAIGLLRQITPTPVPETGDGACGSGSGECLCTAPEAPAAAQDVPPQIAAAFEDIDRHNRIHSPATSLLRTFHAVLDSRVPERTALLAEQLRSPDPGTRHDAIRMAKDLMGSWRGDHTVLVVMVADCLVLDDPYTAAEAAETLGGLEAIAEPAREALAMYVTAQCAAHGPEVWATPKPLLRRAHQEAVRALARLGDMRALPGLLTALDSDVDSWRAVQVAGRLRPAADQLVPRLCRHLYRIDLSVQWPQMSANALLSALAELGDPAAVPPITHTATAAVRHEEWRTAASALEALATFGAAAAPAREVVRALAGADDVGVRVAAAAALWAAEGDPAAVVPLLNDLLDSYRHHEAADVLGRIGPPAARALPRLRKMLTADYEWTRLHAATSLWDIGGPAEAVVVVQTLLTAWEENDATSNHVLACLNRMGAAAAPALPRIRAELALLRRSGRFRSIQHDEELQRTGCAILTRLA